MIVLIAMVLMVLQAGHLKREYLKIGDGGLNMRICLISDFHMGLLMVSEKDIAKALKEENPDVLIIAGDIIESERHIAAFTNLFRQVSPDCPVFLTLGNHDYRCFMKNPLSKELFFFNLKNLGIDILINGCASFYKEEKLINIVGIDDYRFGSPDVKKALSMKNKNADFTVAVAHNPETALLIPPDMADILLCGHFHGGQIWMPFGLEFKIFRKEETSRLGYRRGLCTINGTPVYISRGIGNVVFPFRLGSRPEITFIDI
jgi:predicted MPP superfamily phosphohydrolase